MCQKFGDLYLHIFIILYYIYTYGPSHIVSHWHYNLQVSNSSAEIRAWPKGRGLGGSHRHTASEKWFLPHKDTHHNTIFRERVSVIEWELINNLETPRQVQGIGLLGPRGPSSLFGHFGSFFLHPKVDDVFTSCILFCHSYYYSCLLFTTNLYYICRDLYIASLSMDAFWKSTIQASMVNSSPYN